MYFLSFVIFFWLYVIVIIYNLTTLCVHDILPFMFMFMVKFVFIFHIIFMFHEHIYTYCISYIFVLVSCSVAYGISYTCTVGHLCIHTSFMHSCSSMNLLYLEIGIIPIESSKLKLRHFHAKLVILLRLHYEQFVILFFFSGVITPYMTLVLCIHLNLSAKGSSPTGITQIEAPKLELCPKQPGLLYDQN